MCRLAEVLRVALPCRIQMSVFDERKGACSGESALPSRGTMAQRTRKTKIGRKLMNSCPSEGI
jgi:hypothetical protein